MLSAIDGICFCVKQPLLCWQRKLLKAKHPSWVPLKFAHLIIIHICCKDVRRHSLEQMKDKDRRENREQGTLWCAHILPSCISKSCPISITVEFVLSYEWFLRFIKIRRCRRLLEISGGCVCHPTALQTQYRRLRRLSSMLLTVV